MRRDIRTAQQMYRYWATKEKRAGDVWKAHKAYRETIVKRDVK